MYSRRQRPPLLTFVLLRDKADFVNGPPRSRKGRQNSCNKGLTTTATKNAVKQRLPVMMVDEPYDRRSRRLGSSEVPRISAGGSSVALALCGRRFP